MLIWCGHSFLWLSPRIPSRLFINTQQPRTVYTNRILFSSPSMKLSRLANVGYVAIVASTTSGREQLFRPARKPQSRAQPYPIRGVNQDSNDTVRFGQLGRLVCSILNGCFGAESVAALSRIRRV